MSEIIDYHAHVYFTDESVEEARSVCETTSELFSLTMGQMHYRKVGPHLYWSCQLSFTGEKFGEVVSWLSMHRGELVVLIHPQTGDVLKDHTSHAIWLGQSVALELDALTPNSD